MNKDKHGKHVILLRDLEPRTEVTGGTGTRLFGERQAPAEDPPRPKSGTGSEKKRARKNVAVNDLTVRRGSAAAVRGGAAPLPIPYPNTGRSLR